MEERRELERKTKEELKQLAQGLEITKISTLKKEELIDAILAKREENRTKTEAEVPKKTSETAGCY